MGGLWADWHINMDGRRSCYHVAMTRIASLRSTPAIRLILQAALATLALYGMLSVPALISRWGFSIVGIGVLAAWAVLAGAGAIALLSRRPSWVLGLVLLSGLPPIRFVVGMIAVGRMSPGDPDIYPTIARQLLAGHGLYFDQMDMGVRVFALYPPAYPMLLAGWGALAGFSTASLLVLNLLIDAAAAWMVALIGKRLKAPEAGRAAAFLYLAWPSTLFSAPLAQKEGLAILLVLVLAYVWLGRADGRPGGWRGALALGVPAGLLALTQPGWAPLAALFGIGLAGRIGLRRMLGFGSAGAVVAGMVMLPWWVRNWLMLGAFVPLTSAGGIGLWIGNNPEATGNWMPQPASLYGLPELEFARRAGQMAQAWIVGHPIDFVRLNATKFFRAVGVGQFGPYRFLIMIPPISQALAAMLLPLSHGAHILLLGGGAAALRVGRAPGVSTMVLLILACFAQLALFGVWFEFGERHREFMTPLLLLLGCMAVSGFVRRRV